MSEPTPSKPDLDALAEKIESATMLRRRLPGLGDFAITYAEKAAVVKALRHLASKPSLYEAGLREAFRREILDRLNLAAPAVENLTEYQEQCDADGIMVKVSRQAVDEVVKAVNDVALTAAIAALPADGNGANDIQSSDGGVEG